MSPLCRTNTSVTRYKWWPPRLLQSGLSELPFLYKIICSLDWPRDWEIYLARWVKFTVEKQNCPNFLTKFVRAKNTSNDATNVLLWRIFTKAHKIEIIFDFQGDDQNPRLGQRGRPHSNLHRLHSICFMGYIYTCMNVYLCNLCKLQWDKYDKWGNMAMGFEKQR
jgi:hypothetical protein